MCMHAPIILQFHAEISSSHLLSFVRVFSLFMMEDTCSLSGSSVTVCGINRGVSGLTNLLECNEDISTHLSTCHLSKSNLKEHELILARAGLFNIASEHIRDMTVCPAHRDALGRFWRPRATCQHPAHTGPTSRVKGRHVFNLQMSQDVLTLHGVLVPTGSRKLFHFLCGIKHCSLRGWISLGLREAYTCIRT